MIGRAGRPQFDKTANAVVMTKLGDRVTLQLIYRSLNKEIFYVKYDNF